MAKQIQFEYDGKEYCLEYTRRTVKEMEASGFVASEVSDKPMTALPKLFAGAFKAHHPTEKRERIDEIFQKLPDRKKLIGALAELYAEPMRTLLEEPEEDRGNLITWTGNWNIDEDSE